MLANTVFHRESEIKIEMRKASFGGDRSEAGRYAANVRWQGGAKQKPSNQEKFALKQSKEAKNDLTRLAEKHKEKTKRLPKSTETNLSDDALIALSHWEIAGLIDQNTFLRTGKTENLITRNINPKIAMADIKEDVKKMNILFDELKQETAEELVVFRGLTIPKSEGSIDPYQKTTGFKIDSIIRDKGWQSTTTDPEFAVSWANTMLDFPLERGKGEKERTQMAVFQIKIPKGTKIINLGGIVDKSDANESNGMTTEVLLNRNTKYRVVGKKVVADSSAWAKRTSKNLLSASILVVDLEVVP